MKREIGWDEITRDDDSVLTVGTFDGVHRGHQAIIAYLMERANVQDGTSTLISFDPHPRSVVHDQDVDLLTTVDERAALLEDLGLDRFVVIPFSNEFASIEAERYVREILVDGIGLKEITVGYDHRFGNRREGDVDLLRRMGAKLGFDVDVIPAQEVDHQVVSSSAVREKLRAGDVTGAADMLGRPYALAGTVAHGEGRGRQIGYPTANINVPDPRKLIPQIGVYAVSAELPGGAVHGGMMNIGRRPTFDGMGVTAEVHVFNFSGDLYGERVRVQFLRRVRDEKKFSSVDDLVAQLSEDEVHCKRVIEAFD